MPPIIKKSESIWAQLTRLFKDGPVVRHKIAGSSKMHEPRGTARAYKKELSSLYVNSLASYGQYERLARYGDYCFHPDTMIYTTEGTFSIQELCEKYKPGMRFKVYSYDHDKKKLVVADAHSPRLKREGEVCELLKITLDDGGSIRVTPDHKVLMRDGTSKQACELEENDSLMPFYKKDLSGHGYQWIYTMDRSRCKNGWELEHRLVAEDVLGRELEDDEVVHHRNFERGDNKPRNLEVMLESEHKSYHARLNNKNKLGKPSDKKSKHMRENNPVKRDDVTFSSVVNAAISCDFKLGDVMKILRADQGVIKRRLRERGFKNWLDFKSKRKEVEAHITFEVVKIESSPTIERIIDNHVGCNTIYELCSRIGCTENSIRRRLDAHGYGTWTEFKKSNDDGYDEKHRYSVGSNHKVASIERCEPSVVYNITVEEHHNLAAGSILDDGTVSMIQWYQSEMEYTPEISSALDIYADETTSVNENGHMIIVESEDSVIKKTLETLFFDIINIEFNLHSWVRNLCKYGDFVLFVDASETNGILNLLPIPINEIEREEGYDEQNPTAFRFRWLTQGNMILEAWQIIHFRLLGNDNFLPYGASVVEPARRIWRQLILIEDAMLIYRIVRSPERRVFKIETGMVKPEEIEEYMEKVKTRLKRSQIIDSTTGRVDLRYNPLPVRKDTIVPLLDGNHYTIEELAKRYEQGCDDWVYSVKDGTKNVVPGKIAWCGKNYVCDNLHRVWLDDDTYIDTAPEHPFILSDGTSKRADELEQGDSLMAAKRDVNNRGYERIVEPNGERNSTHVIVARDVHAKRYNELERPVIHHKTDTGCPDKRNNNPNRLEVMDFWEHRKFHADHCELTLNTPERLEERRLRRIEYNKSPEKRRKTSEQNRRYKKAQKMGEMYNGSELHKSHNSVRRDAQLRSWSGDREGRAEAMRWVIPTSVVERAFELVKNNPKIKREELTGLLRDDNETVEVLERANEHNKRDTKKFHVSAVVNKLSRMGVISKNSYSELRKYALHNPTPQNHVVKRVEVLDDVDDVYCMTVVGSQGEDDRHNFAVSPTYKSLIFLRNSVDEDYFIPVREGVGSEIDSLPGGQFTGDIEDVEYIQNKLFAALKIPKAYLGYEGDVGSKATLAQEDVRFSRTIQRIQKTVIAEFNKIAIIHLTILGYTDSDLVNFEIKMANPSTIAEQQKLELWRLKLEIAGTAQEGMLDKNTIRKDIFGFSDKKIQEIEDGQRFDKLFELEMEAMTAPAEEEAPGEAVPGEEELPDTLGGAPGGDEEPPEEPENLEADVERDFFDQDDSELSKYINPELLNDDDDLDDFEEVDEVKNYGSEGDSAELAVDKGKDLFDPGEDLFNNVFDTEKQTASDPYDMRSQRRLVSRPFSENNGVAEYIKGTAKKSQILEEKLGRLNKVLKS